MYTNFENKKQQQKPDKNKSVAIQMFTLQMFILRGVGGACLLHRRNDDSGGDAAVLPRSDYVCYHAVPYRPS